MIQGGPAAAALLTLPFVARAFTGLGVGAAGAGVSATVAEVAMSNEGFSVEALADTGPVLLPGAVVSVTVSAKYGFQG